MVQTHSSFWIAFFLAVATCSADAFGEDGLLKIVGRDAETVAITSTEFKMLPQTEVEARDRDGTVARFKGVEVTQLLNKVGAAQGDKLRGEWLRSFVVVTAIDGYRAVYALPEFDASFTDRKILLADSRNGVSLDERHGPFQIIVPDEKRHSRWVRMVKEIRVVDSKRAE